MSLSVDIKDDKSFAKRVVLNGRLDTNTAPTLEADLDQLVAGPAQLIIFDLERLEYISSAGLRVMFKASKGMTAKSGKCAVLKMQPQIKKVFEIVKALPDVPIFKDDGEMDDYLDVMQQQVLDGE